MNNCAYSETKYLCGCGLSLTFPICDGSQTIVKTRDGSKRFACGAPRAAAAAVVARAAQADEAQPALELASTT